MKTEPSTTVQRVAGAPAAAPSSTGRRSKRVSWSEAARSMPLAAATRALKPPRLRMPKLEVESGAGIARTFPDVEALRALLTVHYGKALEHPSFHLHVGRFDPTSVPHGRFSETDRLLAVVLSPPYALGGDWKYSPIASVRQDPIDVQAALRDHARLTQFYLDNGVQVHFVLHPEQASQAVYCTDVLTSVGGLVVVGNPLYKERQIETDAYAGAVRMAAYGARAPVEWGDVQQAFVRGSLRLLQGVNSQRSNEASVEALARLLHDNKARLGAPYEHIPLYLRQVSTTIAKGTLHLDYAVGHAGNGKDRVLIVAPDALYDPSRAIELLQRVLEVADARVITADRTEMAYGATNLSSLDGKTIVYSEHAALDRLADRLRGFGFDVKSLPMPGLADVDGNSHCATGQLHRARPGG